MGKLAKDETLQETNSLLRILVGEGFELTSYKMIQQIVREGKARDYFKIGDQINVPWRDTAAGKDYVIPFDIVHFGEVETEDGEVRDGIYLQAHYCMPFGIQFSQNEALLYCKEELPTGTYYFTAANNWGNNVVGGTSYHFTLTTPVPVGGQVQIGLQNSEVGACPDQAVANWRIRTYSDCYSTTPIEIVAIETGASGTDLGSWSSSTKSGIEGINNMQRSSYGYNRWSTSAIRQFLNSSETKTKWWKNPGIDFARIPNECATKDGFLLGFGADFLNVIQPIKVTTALNTVSDSVIGVKEDTYDRFFLAAKTNENLNEQFVEGEVWDYWKEATGGVKPADYVTGAAPITYALENNTSPQHVRLRSANRGLATNTWAVHSTGYVSSYSYATYANRFAPACVIC